MNYSDKIDEIRYDLSSMLTVISNLQEEYEFYDNEVSKYEDKRLSKNILRYVFPPYKPSEVTENIDIELSGNEEKVIVVKMNYKSLKLKLKLLKNKINNFYIIVKELKNRINKD
jgi:hypothetical protein